MDIIKSRTEQVLEHKIGEPLDVTLRRLYVERRMNQGDIAAALGVSRQTVNGWLQKYGFVVPARVVDPEPDLSIVT